MPTKKPEEGKPTALSLDETTQSQSANIELADDAFDLLDLGTPQSAAPPSPQNAPPSTPPLAMRTPNPQQLIASELLPSAQPQTGRMARLRGSHAFSALGPRATAGIVLTVLAALAALMWVRLGPGSGGQISQAALTQARAHIAELLPQRQPAAPAVPQPPSLVGAPDPQALPAPVLIAATLSNIDSLDAPSLGAMKQPDLKDPPALDLWAWGQCRRLLAMGDEGAREALGALLQEHAPLPQPSPVGHGRRRERGRARHHRTQAQVWEDPKAQSMRPLQAGAYGCAALLVAPHDRARRTLERLRPLLMQTPQGQLIAALGDGQNRSARAAQAGHDGLTALVAQRPQMADGKIALAKSHFDTGDIAAAMALLSPMAMEDAPEVWARAAHLMWQAKQMTALSQVMARKLGGTKDGASPGGGSLARQLAQASFAHRAVIRRLVMRHLLEEGNVVSALAWAMAQLQQQPRGLASLWDALRLAHLNHTELPPGALEAMEAHQEAQDILGLTLASGGWRLSAPQFQATANQVLSRLPAKSVAPKLQQAMMHERLGATSEAVGVLRSVGLGRREPQVVVTLARAQVASLRPNQPEDRLSALGRLVVPKADLDGELLRPDIAEMGLRMLQAAHDAQRPAQAMLAAQNMLWQDPLAQDPMATLWAWAQFASRQHANLGGDGNSDPGLRRLEQLMAQRPQDDALVERALELAAEVAPGRAIGLHQTLLLRHPKDPYLISRLVETYVALGQHQAAKELVDPLAAGHGTEAHDSNVLYAQALVLAGTEPGQAHALVDKALQGTAPQGRFYNLVASLALSRSLPLEAIEALGRGCALEPNNAPMQLRRAQLLLGDHRPKDADALLLALLGRPVTQEQQAQAWLLRADIAREENDALKVAQALRQAIAVSAEPKAGSIILTLAKIELQELNQGAQALRHLQELVDHEPRNAAAHYYLALALRDQNARARAAEAFGHYLTLAPSGEFATDAREALQDLSH